MTVAICKKCGIEKPHADYYKSTLAKSGQAGVCKSCHGAAMKLNRDANPERTKGYMKACKQRTKDRRARQAADLAAQTNRTPAG